MFQITIASRGVIADRNAMSIKVVDLHELAHIPGMTLAGAEVCAAMLPGAVYEYGPDGERVKVERLLPGFSIRITANRNGTPETWTESAAEFMAANVDMDLRAKVSAMHVGQVIHGGGGAAPAFMIERLDGEFEHIETPSDAPQAATVDPLFVKHPRPWAVYFGHAWLDANGQSIGDSISDVLKVVNREGA